MNTREERLEAACRMVLLFHHGGAWKREDLTAWMRLIATAYNKPAHECPDLNVTTKVLCEAIRAALAESDCTEEPKG